MCINDATGHAAMRALDYIGQRGGGRMTEIAIDRVSPVRARRIEGLRGAARVVNGWIVNTNVRVEAEGRR